MQNSRLNEISNALAADQQVEGWSSERHPDIHVVRQLSPDTLWVRRSPNGEWVKVPGMRGGTA